MVEISSLFNGAILSVETTLGAYDIDIGKELTAEQGPVTKFLRPKVSLKSSSGDVLFSAAPAGDPAQAPPWGTILGAGLAVVLALILLRSFAK